MNKFGLKVEAISGQERTEFAVFRKEGEVMINEDLVNYQGLKSDEELVDLAVDFANSYKDNARQFKLLKNYDTLLLHIMREENPFVFRIKGGINLYS